jgi:hypothetical protein
MYLLITSHDASLPLGEGDAEPFATLLAECNAFAKADAPHKRVIYDDGHMVRDLNVHEERMLHDVCSLLGLEVVDS